MATGNKVSIQSSQYPPVVSVLGHVDHGKTTLLDSIRKTNLAARETGSITQKIGASQIEILHEGIVRKITFIDTPGHEAFSTMRSQGVNASDLALLVVSADDGVMPQTKESIEKILEAAIPMIVVITKADLAAANVERVKQQLLKEHVLLEGLGGDVPYIAVSAKTGEKIHELLDLLLLVYDMSQAIKTETQAFLGVVIDSKLDKKRGVVSSIIVKSGILTVGEKVFIQGKNVGKARALFDTYTKTIEKASPGDAIEILGLTEVFPAGTLVYTKEHGLPEVRPSKVVSAPPYDLTKLFATEQKDTLPVLLKTETRGELEAIRDSLPQKVEVVQMGLGDISASDVLLAKDFNALILGFNVKIAPQAKVLAENERVEFRIYHLIYELLNEVQEALSLLKDRGLPLGKAEVIARFEASKGNILGVKVLEGRIALQDKVTIIHKDKEIGKTKIVSLKRGKQDVREVEKGLESGVLLSPQVDFSIGDMLLSHNK